MTEQTTTKALTVTNYDKIKALARNKLTIERFTEMMGSRQEAMSFISSAMLAVASSEDLMKCTPSSVFNAVMRAGALRLSCDPATKQAHIVPFKNHKTGVSEAAFIPGYVGLNNLALRTGKYRHLNVGRVYDGQVMEIDQLTGSASIRGNRTSDKIIGYFHYFELFNGYKHILYMTTEELKAHGGRYAARNPMWNRDFDSMAKKTVVRLHLLKDGILDPFDRAFIEQSIEELPDGEMIESSNAVDAVFTELDDETATQEAIQKKSEPKKTEAEIMGELYAEKKPEPATAKVEEPKEPAPANAWVYSERGAKVGNHMYPTQWAKLIMTYTRANQFECDGILQQLRPPFDTRPEDVIDLISAHLANKAQAEQK
jgi:recombination protein RecT